MIKNKVTIIAEAGVNHNGDINNALELVEKASLAGADYIKFQTFFVDQLVTKNASLADYQKDNKLNQTQHELLSKLQLTEEMHKILIKHCNKKKIKFISTGFDFKSLDMLNNFNLDLMKIPSGEITNLPYLQKIGSYKKNLILSTGASLLSEIKEAIDILTTSGTERKNITVLHCNSSYPTPYEDVNLNAMNKIKSELNVNIGYSDHTLGIEVPIAAVSMGAKIIEKHFTLNKLQNGPDHKASLEPYELKQMVQSIRNIEKSLGCEIKKPTKSEVKNIKIIRKSIVASKIIKKGQKFSLNNITVKRPGTGISPMKFNDVLGVTARRDFMKDDFIEV